MLTPADDSQAVDHGGVRVGANQTVGVQHAVCLEDDTRQVLEVHLVHDARPGRHDEHVAQGLCAPLEEEEALLVALELHLLVALQGASAATDASFHKPLRRFKV